MPAVRRVVLASDHGGFTLKALVAAHLAARGVEVTDLGVSDDTSVDYPDMAKKAVTAFRQGGHDLGMLFCGTGIGISMAANKMKGIRCALLYDGFSAEMARRHNNANFLAFGGRLSYPEPVTTLVDRFLDTPVEGGRHADRVEKIAALENT